MKEITETAAGVLLAIVGVAILAVLVSRNSQTPAVLQAFGGAFSGILGTAVSPVTGQSTQSPAMFGGNYGALMQGGFPNLGA